MALDIALWYKKFSSTSVGMSHNLRCKSRAPEGALCCVCTLCLNINGEGGFHSRVATPHASPSPSSVMATPEQEPRVWVASLGAYNNGDLHGRWVDVEDEVTLWDGIHSVLRTSPQPNEEEFAFFDYEGFGGLVIREHETIKDTVAIARGIREHGQAFVEWVRYFGREVLHDEDSSFEDSYIGSYQSEDDLQRAIFELVGFDQLDQQLDRMVRDHFRGYIQIDIEGFVRDLQLGGEMYVSEVSGVHHCFWTR